MASKINQSIQSLMSTIPQTGRVQWIGIRPNRRDPMQAVKCVAAAHSSGLDGDHYSSKAKSKRQVTLVQKEHLDVVASVLGVAAVDPEIIRRNLVISGINLLALHNQKFTIGEVVLEGTGYCHPCSRMEENLGPGGYNAMRGHGGITARIVKDGIIHEGNDVNLISNE